MALSGFPYSYNWMTQSEIDAERQMRKELNKVNNKCFIDEIRQFIPSPTQAIFFVLVVFVLDKFLLGGELREYIVQMIKDAKTDKAEK